MPVLGPSTPGTTGTLIPLSGWCRGIVRTPSHLAKKQLALIGDVTRLPLLNGAEQAFALNRLQDDRRITSGIHNHVCGFANRDQCVLRIS